MSGQELIEQLADKEHASWARWQSYLFSMCDVVDDGDGYEDYVIPRELVQRWKRQIATPYVQLSEKEKQSDRDEVAHILPIIREAIGLNEPQFIVRKIAEGILEIGTTHNHPLEIQAHDYPFLNQIPRKPFNPDESHALLRDARGGFTLIGEDTMKALEPDGGLDQQHFYLLNPKRASENARVSFAFPQSELPWDVVIEGGYGNYEVDAVLLSASQALALLKWLEQERPRLETQAAKEQEDASRT